MKNNLKKTIFAIKPYIPGKPIEEVQRELGLKGVIKLASNENPFPPSPKVLKAMAVAARSVNRYPQGDCFYLRKELAKRLNIKPEQLIFGNGSDELIVFAARVFLKQNDEVIIADPSFLIYEIASKLEGAKIKKVPLNNFRYDLNAMIKAITKRTKIIFLGNPDNPAGSYLKEKDVRSFLKNIRQDILVFIDEAYYEFVTAKDYVDSIKLLKQYPNVFVTRTFSKMYGLAGLRIGYGIGNAMVIDWLNRVREPFNVNSIAQAAALACLEDDAYYKKVATTLQKEREYFYRQFERLGLAYIKSDANFILVKLENDAQKYAGKLLEKGMIVRDMSIWGLENYLRVTIGRRLENQKFIKTLEEIL